jgi:hypothetical protein
MLVLSILVLLKVAFTIGVAVGNRAKAVHQHELEAAQKALTDLQAALRAKQFELDQNKQRYKHSISIAFESVHEYGENFHFLDKQQQPVRSAVILPFK